MGILKPPVVPFPADEFQIFCHSREGESPAQRRLDSPSALLRVVSLSNHRLRGNDEQVSGYSGYNNFRNYFWDVVLEAISK